jgi:hypothetical protein
VELVDLSRALRDLYEEKQRLEQAIALLEDLQQAEGDDAQPDAVKRRGRKGMDQDERKEVSVRMRAYWARRRGQKTT